MPKQKLTKATVPIPEVRTLWWSFPVELRHLLQSRLTMTFGRSYIGILTQVGSNTPLKWLMLKPVDKLVQCRLWKVDKNNTVLGDVTIPIVNVEKWLTVWGNKYLKV